MAAFFCYKLWQGFNPVCINFVSFDSIFLFREIISGTIYLNSLVMKKVELSPFVHKGKECIKIQFPLDEELQEIIKKIPGRSWTRTHSCWYVVNRKNILNELFGYFKDKAYLNYRNLKEKPLADPVEIIKLSYITPSLRTSYNAKTPVLLRGFLF